MSVLVANGNHRGLVRYVLASTTRVMPLAQLMLNPN